MNGLLAGLTLAAGHQRRETQVVLFKAHGGVQGSNTCSPVSR